jgi:sodium-dependent phosphate cotransporter
VFGLILFFLVVIISINLIQTHTPRFLPKIFQNWNFLPKPLHSLEPYDEVFKKIKCCNRNDRVSTIDDENSNEI